MSSLTGDVAELVCSVRGKPAPEVQWRKAGGWKHFQLVNDVDEADNADGASQLQ